MKYLFVTAIEDCIDAAHHVAVSEGWAPAETNAGAMEVLGRGPGGGAPSLRGGGGGAR